MSDPLQAYYAEVRAAEDEYFNLHCREGGPIGVSMWPANHELLRQIDDRHGVLPDDPRVYSIAAYKAERRQIDEEWAALCKASKWDQPDLDEKAGQDKWAAQWRHETRITDCLARHFPGLNGLHPRTIDSIPKLWAYITEYLSGILERHYHLHPAPAGARSPTCDENVQQVYSLLHELQVPWAPEPPYLALTQPEALDQLKRIANRLERDEAVRCFAPPLAPHMTRAVEAAPCAAPPAPPAAPEEPLAEGAALPSSTSAASPTGDAPQQQRHRIRREEERLRRLLKVQAGDHPRRRVRSTMACSEVNGVMWPLPSDLDADPIATLRGDCATALHALDKPEPPNVLGGIPTYRAVVRTLPVLAEAVARMRGRPAPQFPVDTQDEEAARRYVETVLDWCEGKAAALADARLALPDDPVGWMRATIARERRVQLTMSGPHLQDSFNWQAGVDRLWKRWDELFPDAVRPDKPICTNYAEASDAAVALLRALPSVRLPPVGGSMGMPTTVALATQDDVEAAAPPASQPTPTPPAWQGEDLRRTVLESVSVVAAFMPIIAVLEGGPDTERAWVSAYAGALTAARDLMHPSDRPDEWAVLADARPEAQIAMDRLHDFLSDLHFSAAFRPARRADKLKALTMIVKALEGAAGAGSSAPATQEDTEAAAAPNQAAAVEEPPARRMIEQATEDATADQAAEAANSTKAHAHQNVVSPAVRAEEEVTPEKTAEKNRERATNLGSWAVATHDGKQWHLYHCVRSSWRQMKALVFREGIQTAIVKLFAEGGGFMEKKAGLKLWPELSRAGEYKKAMACLKPELSHLARTIREAVRVADKAPIFRKEEAAWRSEIQIGYAIMEDSERAGGDPKWKIKLRNDLSPEERLDL